MRGVCAGNCAAMIVVAWLGGVSACWEAPVSSRSRQQTQLSSGDIDLTLSSTTRVFAPHERVEVMVQLTNRTNDTRRVTATTRSPFADYTWALVNEAGRQVPSARHYNAPLVSRSLKALAPREAVTETVCLNEYFDLTLPGRYWCRISTSQSLTNTESLVVALKKGIKFAPLVSNVLQFEIVGAQAQPSQKVADRLVVERKSVRAVERDGLRLELVPPQALSRLADPVEVVMRITNIGESPIGLADAQPWLNIRPIVVFQNARVGYSPEMRIVGLTQFGVRTPICMHRLGSPLAVGESHLEHVYLNQFVNLAERGHYEVAFKFFIRSAADQPLEIVTEAIRFEIH